MNCLKKRVFVKTDLAPSKNSESQEGFSKDQYWSIQKLIDYYGNLPDSQFSFLLSDEMRWYWTFLPITKTLET